MPPKTFPKGPLLARNDEKWNSLKPDIHRIYITESKTLPVTMTEIEKMHGFKGSERKWKEKIKEWGYSKKLSEDDMKVVVAKVAHRSRQGKRTVVSHAGSTIAKERLRNFVRRKTVKSSQAMSPSASTPEFVAYGTPRYDDDSALFIEDAMGQISEEVQSISILDGQTQISGKDTTMSDAQPEEEKRTYEAASTDALTDVSQDQQHPTPSSSAVGREEIAPTRELPDGTVPEATKRKITFQDTDPFDDINALKFSGRESSLNTISPSALTITHTSQHDSQNVTNIASGLKNHGLSATRTVTIPDFEDVEFQLKIAQVLCALSYLDYYDDVEHQYLASYTETSGPIPVPETVNILSSLIDLLFEERKFDEASVLCRKVIQNSPAETDHTQRSQWTLARICQVKERHYDALDLLTFLLSRALQHNFKIVSLETLLYTMRDSFTAIAESLSALKLRFSRQNGDIFMVLDEMVEIVKRHIDWDHEPFPLLLLKAMGLAGWISLLLDMPESPASRRTADLLFKIGLARLEDPSSNVGYRKAAVYYWYANHLNRQSEVIKSASYLLDSWAILVEANRSSGSLGSRVLKKMQEIFRQIIQLNESTPSAETSSLVERFGIPQLKDIPTLPKARRVTYVSLVGDDFTSPGTDRTIASSRSGPISSTMDDSKTVFTTSTKSFKFGETFSESEYLGFSVAELMGPYKE